MKINMKSHSGFYQMSFPEEIVFLTKSFMFFQDRLARTGNSFWALSISILWGIFLVTRFDLKDCLIALFSSSVHGFLIIFFFGKGSSSEPWSLRFFAFAVAFSINSVEFSFTPFSLIKIHIFQTAYSLQHPCCSHLLANRTITIYQWFICLR